MAGRRRSSCLIDFDDLDNSHKGAVNTQMTLVNIVVILVVVGLVMWLINTYIPMAGAIKSLLNIVVFVVVLIWILQTFGIIGAIPGVRMPALK